jgi:hypothetical protein
MTDRTWDYDDLIAMAKAEEPPYIKVTVAWPDGGTEGPWAIDLGDGFALLANTPLYPKYRFHDVVRLTSRGVVEKLIFRPLPTKIVFLYEPKDDEKADIEQRRAIGEAVETFGAVPGFFVPGEGYALLRDGTDKVAVAEAIRGTDVPILDLKEQIFDVDTDEYEYLDVGQGRDD